MNNINEFYNIDENENKKTMNNKKNIKYKCVFHCPLLYNDIVSSIDIYKDKLVYGTLMGEISICFINVISNNKQKETEDSYNTNANITIDNDNMIQNKKEKKIQEIRLKPNNNNISKNNNKKIKDIKIFRNKDIDSEEIHHYIFNNEDLYSYGSSSKKIKLNKFYYNDSINNKIQIKKLYQHDIENISCVSLYNDILNFSIGDYQLVHCEKISHLKGNDLKKAFNFKLINNYTSDKTHNDFCETAQCFISNNHYLIIYFFYYDFSWPLRFNQVKYENKNLLNFEEIIKGTIYMSNFNVPFDFDGDKFLYLEHYSKTLRCINVFSTLKEQKIFKLNINNEFEHISHMKLLPNDSIFICRKIFICEIYKYKNNNINNNTKNKDFVLLKTWTHIYNKEIISSNIYIKDKIINEKSTNSIITKYIKNKKENSRGKIKLNLKLLESDNSIDSNSTSKNKILNNDNYNNKYINLNLDNSDNDVGEEIIRIKTARGKSQNIKVNYNYTYFRNNTNDENKNIIDENNDYYIITLDEDGNFNLYYFNQEKNKEINNTLFNIYDIQNIEQKYKDVQFFSRGFPYYIIMNDLYYVITSDIGIFVVNSEKE